VKIYCVMEGREYPEGAPIGIFNSLVEARVHIEIKEENSKDYCIYEYETNRHGYLRALNYLGEPLNEA